MEMSVFMDWTAQYRSSPNSFILTILIYRIKEMSIQIPTKFCGT